MLVCYIAFILTSLYHLHILEYLSLVECLNCNQNMSGNVIKGCQNHINKILKGVSGAPEYVNI